ncbi:MAG: hypothetical protein IT435_02360 [Phycisphaerales bacterium]|nr:hypothetical protein [Phycisphaerales bacterium]
MPAPNTETARNEILDRLKDALDVSAFAGIVVEYDDTSDDHPQGEPTVPVVPAGQPWLRAGVRHADGGRASLGSVNGKRRQEASGIVFVQVFTPSGDGMKMTDALVDIILDAYRTGGATASGVQFRSARFSEAGKSGVWQQTNCLVDFQYDLIR